MRLILWEVKGHPAMVGVSIRMNGAKEEPREEGLGVGAQDGA